MAQRLGRVASLIEALPPIFRDTFRHLLDTIAELDESSRSNF